MTRFWVILLLVVFKLNCSPNVFLKDVFIPLVPKNARISGNDNKAPLIQFLIKEKNIGIILLNESYVVKVIGDKLSLEDIDLDTDIRKNKKFNKPMYLFTKLGGLKNQPEIILKKGYKCFNIDQNNDVGMGKCTALNSQFYRTILKNEKPEKRINADKKAIDLEESIHKYLEENVPTIVEDQIRTLNEEKLKTNEEEKDVNDALDRAKMKKIIEESLSKNQDLQNKLFGQLLSYDLAVSNPSQSPSYDSAVKQNQIPNNPIAPNPHQSPFYDSAANNPHQPPSYDSLAKQNSNNPISPNPYIFNNNPQQSNTNDLVLKIILDLIESKNKELRALGLELAAEVLKNPKTDIITFFTLATSISSIINRNEKFNENEENKKPLNETHVDNLVEQKILKYLVLQLLMDNKIDKNNKMNNSKNKPKPKKPKPAGGGLFGGLSKIASLTPQGKALELAGGAMGNEGEE